MSLAGYIDIPLRSGRLWPAASAFLREEIAAQRDRLIYWAPVVLAIGIGVYFALDFEPPAFIGYGLLLVCLSLCVLQWDRRFESGRHYAVCLITLVFLLFSAGFSAAQLRTSLVSAPMLARPLDPVSISGTVSDIEQLEPGKGIRLILSDPAVEGLAADKTPARVRLKVRDGGKIRLGDRIEALAGLNPPGAPVAPGAFDFQRYAYFKRIGAFGFAYKEPVIIKPGRIEGISFKLEQARQAVTVKIERAVKGPEKAFIIALLTGERGAISEDDWDAMRDSGLAHMLAISGLHVGLVAGCVFFFSRFLMVLSSALALRYPIKKYAALTAMLAAFSYMMLVGATVSTQRAMFMTGVVLLAVILDRVAVSLRLVALAAFLILACEPEMLLNAGFHMSFAAVAALVVFYEAIRSHWSKWHSRSSLLKRAALYFLGVCLTTLVASTATAPFSLFHFQQYPVFSLLSNLFAVPLLALVIMPAAVLAYLGLPLGWEGIGLKIMAWGIVWVRNIAHDVAALQGAVINPPAWPFASFMVFIAGAVFWLLWQGRLRHFGLLVMVLSMFIINQYKQEDILVSSSGKLIMIREGSEAALISSGRTERFTADIWRRQFGLREDQVMVWPKEGQSGRTGLACDGQGCRYSKGHHKIAFPYSKQALAGECDWAGLVVAPYPVKLNSCRAQVIDLYDLYDHGAYALRLEHEGIRTSHVERQRGSRPWTVTNRH